MTRAPALSDVESRRRRERELASEIAAMTDGAIERIWAAVLGARRSAHEGESRDSLIAQLSCTQRMDEQLQYLINDLANRIYSGKHPKHWLWKSHKQFILDRVAPGDRILDIGCGASAYLLWMAEKGCKVTGCDFNPNRIEQARTLMAHPNLSFLCADVMRDVPSGQFDIAICSHVIEHLDDPVALLSRLTDLVPQLIVAVPPKDSRWQKVMYRDLGLPWKDDEDHRREYDTELLCAQLTHAGWKPVELHDGIDIKAVAVRAGS